MSFIKYHNTNNLKESVTFETALLTGQPKDFGLYMMSKADLPKIQLKQILNMTQQSYAQIAYQVLSPFLTPEIVPSTLETLLNDAYHPQIIPTNIQHVTNRVHIMWLTQGPTYSFKDYAARFFGRVLDYYLGKRDIRRVVIVATSGDTGGAVADALFGLNHVDTIVFYPKGSVSEGQRRQMTTLGKNISAFEVNGDFDVCQTLAKSILGDKVFANDVFGDSQIFTSANSISIGRLLPQSVYPFFAYSRVANDDEPIIVSIPSGNFGDMMGTVLAKYMGLPIEKIICGVNENREFSDFLETGRYEVKRSKSSPSSAMNVSHPSNLARLIDFYDGHMYDKRNPKNSKVIIPGIIDRMPDLAAMRKDIFSVSVNDSLHYQTMKRVFDDYGIILDPHGAVGWRALELYLDGNLEKLSVIYETADPGKFPNDVKKAIDIIPDLPSGMKKQSKLPEIIYSIESPSEETKHGLKLTQHQLLEAKEKMTNIFQIR